MIFTFAPGALTIVGDGETASPVPPARREPPYRLMPAAVVRAAVAHSGSASSKGTTVSLVLDDPLAGADPAATPSRDRPWWYFWVSPSGQGVWVRPSLLLVAGLAGVLFGWNVASSGLAPFYAVAVKSMSVSWKAFFFGGFDPAATITIDKLAGSFLPQALSARAFGFHAWSLALPQVLEGVASVLVLFRAVRRFAGQAAGLLAAALLALTPIAASMFGHSMEDAALTLCLICAADAFQAAVTTGRLRLLLAAGAWVGLAFQTKMLQAWVILPALALAYALTAPTRLRTRLAHLAAAGAVTLAVSLSWITLYSLTPAHDRPYIDGSTTNSAYAMVFGYNGLERFGITTEGAVTAMIGEHPPADAGGTDGPRRAATPHGGPARAGSGWTKLAGSRFGPEISWLFPLALLTLLLGLAWRRRAPRTDALRGGLILWGAWLLTFGAVFSAMHSIPHTAYMASLAPPLAALGGTGIAMLWRVFREGGRGAWTLPVAIAAELGWSLHLWSGYGDFLPWARRAVVVAGVVALAVTVAALAARRTRARPVTAGLLAGVVAMVGAPAAWAASALDLRYDGNALDASAGPAGGMDVARAGFDDDGVVGQAAGRGRDGAAGRAGHMLASMMAGPVLNASEQRVDDYVRAHRSGAAYLMAVSSWTAAAPYIEATGQEVLPMGGFSGTVPEPTLDSVRALVRTGRLRFFLLGGRGIGGLSGAHGRGAAAAAVAGWVERACPVVPPSVYGESVYGESAHATRAGRGLGGETGTLYQCSMSAAVRTDHGA